MIENSLKPIPVLVSGALGRMGSEVVNTVLNSTDCELVAAIDINEKNNGSNISELLKVKNCDIFVASLIFIEDLAQKVVDAVSPFKDKLKASIVFPSMPEVMRLNKLGSFLSLIHI